MALIGGRVERLTVYGFRSLRKLSIPFDHLAVYLGANGTGKTNIYRALELCHHAAKGDLSIWLASQGGMNSALWAGPRKTHDDHIIDIAVDVGCYRYCLKLGLKTPTTAAFDGEPLIKNEAIEYLSSGRKYTVMERNGPAVTVRGPNNRKELLDLRLLPTETAISAVTASHVTSEIAELRDTFLDWRFYHAFRVDTDAPVRQPCDAVTATRLDADGGNLAAVFATLEWIRQDTVDLREIISEAFEGASLKIPSPTGKAEFSIAWQEMPNRDFSQKEISDGTIQFLALCGALLSYNTPNLIVLNEPETSLHPDLMPALAQLISKASENAQIIVVTHSERLTTELEQHCACPIRTVYKNDGETKIDGLSLIGEFKD
ncbi:MAG: AAA family ATPase [Pseudomonadota bacterium]